MKKVFLAIAIFVFAGSVSATAFKPINIEHNEKEGKKDKKKSKKECHSSDAGAETKSCSKGTEGKGCCSKAKTEEKKEK